MRYKYWDDYSIGDVSYLDGHHDPNKYAIEKWVDCEPHEATDWNTGKKVMIERYCYVIAELTWDEHEKWFEFSSVGMRYIEDRKDGLEEFIISFVEEETKRRTKREEF